jgi:predicted nucleic acid-binding protein
MIAVDTSAMVAYLSGTAASPDLELIQGALSVGDLTLPPVVLTELLSSRSSDDHLRNDLTEIPLLPITDGYWARAGQARRLLRSKGLKARTADALIAQVCIDNDVALITRDKDFRHFAKHCGLKLA